MKSARETKEPVIVRPENPIDIKQEELDDLIEWLRSEDLDARPARIEGEGFGVDAWWEIVAIWVGLETSKAAIQQIVTLTMDWARERFRRPPESRHLRGLPKSSQRRKGLRVAIVQYEGNEGQVVEVVELESEDAEPVRRPPEGFERNTRFRPPERVERVAGAQVAPREDIAQELTALELPAPTVNEEELLRETRERLYQRASKYPTNAVLDAWLLIEVGAHAAAIRNNIDLSTETTHILRALADRKRVPEFVADATRTLGHIRSRVAPRPLPGLPTYEAIAYVDTVARVIAYLARA